ncbi:NADPH:quinone oxidoreductase family protein [Quisquiliibacterium transsilvanicum]|uniref:NADPH2:quinone reductase n=1 Tax=Quisquiliibacterium transsilvanicum TaxID=1549638 RepID=A0A7W8MAH3_9BURK|nr:NADPH:quinone oxidoreductase family protein [Quisquiliibacterium transsilvanicum]MBB5273672.1 NADPH2:quinone reductase [Quisquiliibacterium transsilvanicum]
MTDIQRATAPGTTTDTYRAFVCHRLSEDLSGVELRSLPRFAPGPREVAVDLRAASVNFPDLLMTKGLYQFRPDPPFVLGMEGAGIVAAVGSEVREFSVGDRVLAHQKTGCYAERIVLPSTSVRALPAGHDFAQGAAFQAAAITSYVALVRKGGLAAGETLLVHGASGGVGMAAVQLGRHLGARVIATGTSDEKLAIVRAQGADEVINLTREDLRERVKELTGGRGADVIYDPIGGDVFDASTRCIAWDGRLLVIGFVSGRIPTIAANIPLIKGFSVVGVRAGEYGRRDPLKGAENLRAIDLLAEQGVFRPHISDRFPLERALDALRHIADRKVVGKVVIEMPARG